MRRTVSNYEAIMSIDGLSLAVYPTKKLRLFLDFTSLPRTFVDNAKIFFEPVKFAVLPAFDD